MIVITDGVSFLTGYWCVYTVVPLIVWWLLARRAGWC